MKRIVNILLTISLLSIPLCAVASASVTAGEKVENHSRHHNNNNSGKGFNNKQNKHSSGNKNSGNRIRGNRNNHDSGKKHNYNHNSGYNKHKNNGHDKKPPVNRPGYKPNGSHPRPGHGGHSSHFRPAHNHIRPVPHPVYRPHHPNHAHYPALRSLIRRAIRGGSGYTVWQVAPETYVVRYLLGNNYYMQCFYPSTGRYGEPFPIYNINGRWYDDDNYEYYDDGNVLRISLNGNPLNPWTLIPSVNLNLRL